MRSTSVPLELRLENQFGAIAAASHATREHLTANNVPDDVIFFADLVLEEMITNTIKYGYDDSATHEIAVQITVHGSRVVVRITDDGHAFNPLDLPEPDTTLPGEERPIGGLGVHFVRRLADAFEYERAGVHNVTTIARNFPPADGTEKN